MSRVHDVGGQTGFGPVPVRDHGEDGDQRDYGEDGDQRGHGEDGDDGPPFHADWEARVWALAGVLGQRGLFTGDELRDAIESLPPEHYLSASYYERWLDALEILVARKGIR